MKTIAHRSIRRWLYISLWISLSGLSWAASVGRAAVHTMCKTSDTFQEHLIAPLDLERWDGRNVAFSLLANTIELASGVGARVQVRFVDTDTIEEQQCFRLFSVAGLQPNTAYEIYIPEEGAFEESFFSLLREVYIAYELQLSLKSGKLSRDTTREEFLTIYRQAYLSAVEMVSGSLKKDLQGWIKSQEIKVDQKRWVIAENPNLAELLKEPRHAQADTSGISLHVSYQEIIKPNRVPGSD